ncbi:MAG TPA: hypothetical protein VEJ20_10080, partial [Candidatus Eremiobacteraceae bacterium]|nr:hypothetical protein [Candidatus Eremiobacteraceae bacterium]
GGLHGVGISVTNALSEWMVTRVKRDQKLYQMKFARGQVTSKLAVIGDAARGAQAWPGETTQAERERVNAPLAPDAWQVCGIHAATGPRARSSPS